MTNEIIDHHETGGRSCGGAGRKAVEWHPLRGDTPRADGADVPGAARPRTVPRPAAALVAVGLLLLVLGAVLGSLPLLVGGAVITVAAGTGILAYRRSPASRRGGARERAGEQGGAPAGAPGGADAETVPGTRSEPEPQAAAEAERRGPGAQDDPAPAPAEGPGTGDLAVEEPVRERQPAGGLFIPSPGTPAPGIAGANREKTGDDASGASESAVSAAEDDAPAEPAGALAAEPETATGEADTTSAAETEAPTTDALTPATEAPAAEPEPAPAEVTDTAPAAETGTSTDTLTPATEAPTTEPEPATDPAAATEPEPAPTDDAPAPKTPATEPTPATDAPEPEPETTTGEADTTSAAETEAPTDTPAPETAAVPSAAPQVPAVPAASAPPTDDPFARYAEEAGVEAGTLREIAQAVVTDQSASIVYVQQRFSLSRPAARRVLDALERIGLVSAPAKNGRRKTTATSLDHLAPPNGR
ncbi:hypothetical protein [Streptomyces sp. URMC 125]|uniref:hypothetical protein n=1 Tax=Streptomyces sp. URMC 125 TaxID=3423419 RepID=UPI003F194B8D